MLSCEMMIDILIDDTRDPIRCLALDEALVRGAPPRPILWIWQSTPCVIVGRYQRLSRVVDTVACARDGVPILRRAGGGRPSYDGVHISLITPRDLPRVPLDNVLDTPVSMLRGRTCVAQQVSLSEPNPYTRYGAERPDREEILRLILGRL